MNGEFTPGSIVHMRANLVYLEDASVIEDDGHLDDEDAVKVTPWSRQNKTRCYKAAAAPAAQGLFR